MSKKTDEELEAEIIRLGEELEKRKAERLKRSWPQTVTLYVHGDKESNWSQARELKLNEEAQRTFAYTGLEVELTLVVQEDGTSVATHLNKVALETPVEI